MRAQLFRDVLVCCQSDLVGVLRPKSREGRSMRLSHKAGSDYGINYGVVAALSLWIIATIVLVVVLVVRGNSQNVTPARNIEFQSRYTRSPI